MGKGRERKRREWEGEGKGREGRGKEGKGCGPSSENFCLRPCADIDSSAGRAGRVRYTNAVAEGSDDCDSFMLV